ncbi:MAG TPA: SDR family oxidoreductase [Alphaproteobacteria bacterium]|nr:SDR family oxidoreductase [Alphaproteobacteria bacterium]
MSRAGGGVLLITGGSRGIGAATAKLAASRGWRVCLSYVRDDSAAKEVVRAITGAGGEALAVRADMRREAEIVALFDDAERAFGPVTGLVNNAGITGRIGPLPEAAPETIREVVEVNVTGAILAAREAVLWMSTARGGAGGAIVNISSGAASLGSSGEYVHYAASKGAIDTFTLGLAREVAREGIRVNAVAPGLILTDIHAAGGEPGRAERIAPTVPMGRPGAPEEVAEPILFLLSPAASYITGAVLRVAGGR